MAFPVELVVAVSEVRQSRVARSRFGELVLGAACAARQAHDKDLRKGERRHGRTVRVDQAPLERNGLAGFGAVHAVARRTPTEPDGGPQQDQCVTFAVR